MGAILVMELLANQPPSPPAEWWLLLHLAADADDCTRRAMPGYDFMAERTHAPRATVYRWLKKLHDGGLIRTVEKSAGAAGGQKGKRAVYEIQIPSQQAARITDHLSGVGSHGGRPDLQAGDAESGLTIDGTRLPGQVPQLVRPPIYGPVSDAPVEGAQRTARSRSRRQERNEDQFLESA